MNRAKHLVRAALTGVLLGFATALVAADAPPEPAALIEALGLEAAPRALRELPGWTPPRKIVVRVADARQLRTLAAAAPGVELVPATNESEALAQIAGADALIGFCSAELVARGHELRWIQLYSAGAGPCLAIPAVRARNLLVTNMQRVSGPEIAEHVIAMLLAFTRGLTAYLPTQSSGTWEPDLVAADRLWVLEGRTLLVVGLGGIGTEVARRAAALGMRVLATRASDAPAPAFVSRVAGPAELLELAAEADVVVNCTPLLPSTERLFDAGFFRAMKPGGLFFNVGRGRSVVTEDLLAALRAGSLAGAGLDVTEPEPLPPEHPLWQMPNVIITPHVAARSDRISARVMAVARENLRRYAAGEPLLSLVDPARGY